jgi:CheY-like chemotaxis protein
MLTLLLRLQPICALTGNARDQQIQTCLASGFDAVVTKPYKFDEILDKIKALAGLASPLPSPATQ